jgi:hypothetical protein
MRRWEFFVLVGGTLVAPSGVGWAQLANHIRGDCVPPSTLTPGVF